MVCIDYGRSFLAGKAAWNSVRFWIESRTHLIDERTGTCEDYYQCGSCKSENTFAERDLFQDDNYDFLPIFGPRWGVIFRRRAWLNPNYKSCVKAQELWEGQDLHIVERPDARSLESNAEIRQATARWDLLVARVEIRNDKTGLRAIIECPVKTMNIERDKDIYQVDTGPIVLPDLESRHEPAVDGFSLAFVVFNAPNFADFVIETPTPIEGGKSTIYHYSRRVSTPSVNTILAHGP
jgi:hypothetical protein